MELDTLESFVIRGSTVLLTQNFTIHKDWNTACEESFECDIIKLTSAYIIRWFGVDIWGDVSNVNVFIVFLWKHFFLTTENTTDSHKRFSKRIRGSTVSFLGVTEVCEINGNCGGIPGIQNKIKITCYQRFWYIEMHCYKFTRSLLSLVQGLLKSNKWSGKPLPKLFTRVWDFHVEWFRPSTLFWC